MPKTKNILLLVESSLVYGRKVALGVSHYAREQGDWMLYIEPRDLFSPSRLLAQGWTGDGIITRTVGENMRNALNRVTCPIVELLGNRETIEVMSDTYRSMELCIKHYQEKGVSSFAFYGFGRNWWIDGHKQNFLEITHRYGLDARCFVDTSTKASDLLPQWSEQYEKSLVGWMKTLPPQTGFIVPADYQAIDLLNTCQMIGIAVPEQMGILGMNNDEYLCNLTTPPLSSLDENLEMIGYRAAELLDHKMTKRKAKGNAHKVIHPILVPPKGVVVRQSTEICTVEDEDVATALRYIAEFALQGISIADVVNHVGISRSTLYRRFQQALHRSPKDEIVRIRMEHAKFLLAKTNVSIHTIALKTSYPVVRYFTAVFHSYTGQTPANYRREAWKFKMPAFHEDASDG